jgi:hypothetical protein
MVCTIVKATEYVGLAYGQRQWQKQKQHLKRPVKEGTRKLNRICKATVRPSSL